MSIFRTAKAVWRCFQKFQLFEIPVFPFFSLATVNGHWLEW
jgi:hypothetical protein